MGADKPTVPARGFTPIPAPPRLLSSRTIACTVAPVIRASGTRSAAIDAQRSPPFVGNVQAITFVRSSCIVRPSRNAATIEVPDCGEMAARLITRWLSEVC